VDTSGQTFTIGDQGVLQCSSPVLPLMRLARSDVFGVLGVSSVLYGVGSVSSNAFYHLHSRVSMIGRQLGYLCKSRSILNGRVCSYRHGPGLSQDLSCSHVVFAGFLRSPQVSMLIL